MIHFKLEDSELALRSGYEKVRVSTEARHVTSLDRPVGDIQLAGGKVGEHRLEVTVNFVQQIVRVGPVGRPVVQSLDIIHRPDPLEGYWKNKQNRKTQHEYYR